MRPARSIDGVLERWTTLRGPDGFTFRDLVEVGRREQSTIAELADWLSRARAAGTIGEAGLEALPTRRGAEQQRYRVTDAHPSAALAY